MNKLHKPTYEERQMLLQGVMVDFNCDYDTAIKKLSVSCGNSESNVKKNFAKPGTNNYRDCPPAVWRAWSIDFLDHDPMDEVEYDIWRVF